MKTIKKVQIEPVYVDEIPDEREEYKVYISEKFNVAVHNCLCGCKVQTVMPLNHGTGIMANHGWVLIKHENGEVSFSPSIANYQFPCKSHYIITKNIANFV